MYDYIYVYALKVEIPTWTSLQCGFHVQFGLWIPGLNHSTSRLRPPQTTSPYRRGCSTCPKKYVGRPIFDVKDRIIPDPISKAGEFQQFSHPEENLRKLYHNVLGDLDQWLKMPWAHLRDRHIQYIYTYIIFFNINVHCSAMSFHVVSIPTQCNYGTRVLLNCLKGLSKKGLGQNVRSRTGIPARAFWTPACTGQVS